MYIENIREAFSKGAVVIESKSVFVLYAYKAGWFAQSLEGDGKITFDEMLNKSERVIFHSEAGRRIYIAFIGEFDLDTGDARFFPMVQEKSMGELIRLLESSEVVNGEFIEEFNNKSNDYNDMLDLASRMLDSVREKISDSMQFSSSAKWNQMLEIVNKNPLLLKNLYEIDSPDGEFPGSITFDFDNKTVVFAGESKNMLQNLVYKASEVLIEGEVESGKCSLCIFE